MHAVSTNQTEDILHFSNEKYNFPEIVKPECLTIWKLKQQ